MIVGEPAMDADGNLTIKNYADVELVIPFFDVNGAPRDMTNTEVVVKVDGLPDVSATAGSAPHIKKVTFLKSYADGFQENRPRQYAIIDMGASLNGQEIISGSIRAKKMA